MYADILRMSDEAKVIYNGACPVCTREVDHYRRVVARNGAAVSFLDAGCANVPDIEPEALKRRLHALDETGRLHVGLDAFFVIWDRLPRYRWLSWVFSRPVIRPITAWLYENVVSLALYHWAKRRERRMRPA